MAFVEVVAGCDRWVGAELFTEFGVAFDADAEWGFVELLSANIFASVLKTES
jgi:hypothetical protein